MKDIPINSKKSSVFYYLCALVALGQIMLFAGNSLAANGLPTKEALSTVIQETSVGNSDDLHNQSLLLEIQSEALIDAFSNKTTKKKKKIKKPKDTYPAGSEPVGPDIRGEWTGYIDLVGKEPENVSATVHQNGNYVVITTSSHQKYGRKFIGTIKQNGFLLAYDQKTGEDWSTHREYATSNKIDLYDFVNVEKKGYHQLDRLYLQR